MANDVTRSKFLSLVLRHDPAAVGLVLDNEGWVSIDDLLQRASPSLGLDRAGITRIVATNDKQRFVLSADGQRIRANQGHSIPVDLGLTPKSPPEFLFHGTATRFVPSILEQGLIAGSRQHVHLSDSFELARKVGQRHGRPVVLEVSAGRMFKEGLLFYLSENGVWLTDHVPIEQIRVLPE